MYNRDKDQANEVKLPAINNDEFKSWITAEADSDEVTFTPIVHELTRCQVFQRTRDFAPGNSQRSLHITYCCSPIRS